MVETRKLTLHIDGRRITAERFRRAFDDFFEVVSDVSEAVTGERKAIDWIVTVASGSINLGVAAEPRQDSIRSAEVVHVVYSGFQELSKKSAARPEFFSDNALEKMRDLIRLQDGKAVSTIQVRRSRSRVTLNQKVLVNVERILGGTLAEIGTIEGRLDMVSYRNGLHIGVWDVLTDRAVRCNIAPDLLEKAIEGLKKRRRVAVSGRIRYRQTGEPVSIDVKDLELFPPPEELPSADAVYGILSKI